MPLLKTDLEHLLSQIEVQAVGVSDAGMRSQLYDTLFDFFRVTSSWVEQIDFTAVAETLEYSLVPQEGGIIVGLAGVLDSNSQPVPAIMPAFGTVTLRDNPVAGNTLTAYVIKNVTRPVGRDMVPEAPDWTLSIYGTVILSGLLGQLMAQPDKSYSNMQMSAYHLRKFNDGMAGARTDALRRNTVGSQAWRFPNFGRTGSQRGAVSVGSDTQF